MLEDPPTENPQPESPGGLGLWSDDPASVDLLAFNAIAETLVEAVLDDALDPVALGLSGIWGSGKTTVLRLVEQELERSNTTESKVLLVPTDPWRYDPAVGAKETLIGAVLDRLRTELDESTADETTKEKALGLLAKLVRRVDWAKALRLAARTSVTLQLPSVDDVLSLVRPAPGAEDDSVPGLDAFRDEFSELMSSEALAHVRRVVLLVDDLDRCLPETVIETLETIRLFLAVPKMSFVIAADDQRVAEAIRTRFAQTDRPAPSDVRRQGTEESSEEPAQLYLHKIVQTTVPIPSLSRFDTEAYLILLQLSARLDRDGLMTYVDRCDQLRRESGNLDGLPDTAADDISKEIGFAAAPDTHLLREVAG